MTSFPPPPPLGAPVPATDTVIADTVRWLERAVIGLNLCPFAKGVHVKGQIHYAVAPSADPDDLLPLLRAELLALHATPAEVRDTTLVVVPCGLEDFLDFNDFLNEAEALLHALDLEGVLQIASFHPRFQFAGTDADDVTNCTNRSPYPTLHLIREASIDRAVQAFPDAETIFERNMEVLEGMGPEGWRALDVGAAGARVAPGPAAKDAAPVEGKAV